MIEKWTTFKKITLPIILFNFSLILLTLVIEYITVRYFINNLSKNFITFNIFVTASIGFYFINNKNITPLQFNAWKNFNNFIHTILFFSTLLAININLFNYHPIKKTFNSIIDITFNENDFFDDNLTFNSIYIDTSHAYSCYEHIIRGKIPRNELSYSIVFPIFDNVKNTSDDTEKIHGWLETGSNSVHSPLNSNETMDSIAIKEVDTFINEFKKNYNFNGLSFTLIKKNDVDDLTLCASDQSGISTYNDKYIRIDSHYNFSIKELDLYILIILSINIFSICILTLIPVLNPFLIQKTIYYKLYVFVIKTYKKTLSIILFLLIIATIFKFFILDYIKLKISQYEDNRPIIINHFYEIAPIKKNKVYQFNPLIQYHNEPIKVIKDSIFSTLELYTQIQLKEEKNSYPTFSPEDTLMMFKNGDLSYRELQTYTIMYIGLHKKIKIDDMNNEVIKKELIQWKKELTKKKFNEMHFTQTHDSTTIHNYYYNVKNIKKPYPILFISIE
jgi:hypothetical protein